MPRQSTLIRAFVELADTLVDDFDVVELLMVLSERCVDILDVTAAGIMLVSVGGEPRAMASSNDAMRMMEIFEIQSKEGPCLDCYRAGQAVINQDLTQTLDRWPRFTPEARSAGFRSVHAVPMRLRGDVIGALNLFNTEMRELRGEDIEIAQALADVATIAILQHRAALEAQLLNDQLSHALNTRIAIEQAKGMVAEREALTVDEAFDRLRGHARRHSLRLVDVARAVIDGDLPPSALDPL